MLISLNFIIYWYFMFYKFLVIYTISQNLIIYYDNYSIIHILLMFLMNFISTC